MTQIRLGIDFGGTKIEIAALDDAGAFLLREAHRQLPVAMMAPCWPCAIWCWRPSAKPDPARSGIGVPGSQSPRTGRIRNANSTWLNGRPFKDDLETALGREIRLANDANCLALSRRWTARRQARPASSPSFSAPAAAADWSSTRGWSKGRAEIAGEVGHIALPWPTPREYPGPDCWCGLRSCLETWVSGDRLPAGLRGRDGPDAIRRADRCSRARRGSGGGAKRWRPISTGWRAALPSSPISSIGACFVLGGGMSNVGELYGPLPALVRHYAFSDGWDGTVVQAKWGRQFGRARRGDAVGLRRGDLRGQP